jgi:hypothetical protein
MALPRVFTPAEVQALIPELAELVGRQLERQSEIEQCLAELARRAGGLPHSLADEATDSQEIAGLKSELRARIARYERGWLDVQALGAVVKDPQVGLVDFYGRVDGKLVWLCWRYGEESLRYWHELDAGYAARRPLHPDAIARFWN